MTLRLNMGDRSRLSDATSSTPAARRKGAGQGRARSMGASPAREGACAPPLGSESGRLLATSCRAAWQALALRLARGAGWWQATKGARAAWLPDGSPFCLAFHNSGNTVFGRAHTHTQTHQQEQLL